MALEKNKNDDNVLYMLGSIEAENNNLSAASNYFKSAVNANPKNIEAWRNYARAQRMMKNYGESIGILKNAIKFHPQESNFYYEIGLIYFYDLKNYDEALVYLKKVLEINPNHDEAYAIKQLISIAEAERKK